MKACSVLVSLRKGMQRSSEQPLVGSDALGDYTGSGCEGDYAIRSNK